MNNIYFCYEVVRTQKAGFLVKYGESKEQAAKFVGVGAIRAFNFAQKPELFKAEISEWLFELDILGSDHQDILNQLLIKTFYICMVLLKEIKDEGETRLAWIGFKLNHEAQAALPINVSISREGATGYQTSREYRAFNFKKGGSLKNQIKAWLLECNVLDVETYLENTRVATTIYLALKAAER